MPRPACGRRRRCSIPYLRRIFSVGRALWGPRRLLVGDRVRHAAGGVSYSSLLITTDVPLVLLWTLAFYGWIRLIETGEMRFAALIGASIGLGLLAKYAAAYFVLCVAVDAWRDPRARDALRGGRGVVWALAIASAFIAPNVLWNASHSFATFSHRRKCRLEGSNPQSWLWPRVYRLAICRVRSDPVCGAHRRCLAGVATRLRAA